MSNKELDTILTKGERIEDLSPEVAKILFQKINNNTEPDSTSHRLLGEFYWNGVGVNRNQGYYFFKCFFFFFVFKKKMKKKFDIRCWI